MGKHFGNLQKVKEGRKRYAITPNIIAGFILPDQLETIAKVTKKYKGVLKITSGQRIMITELKEEDLPKIWEELDMEPAVELQNAIKNVQMCPAGFCKRMKYNTIGIGMKLYNKYFKMEMPCRTKISVAGCRNACGGVYSKDVGVIADTDGLLMVVAGGSSGYHPRIADIVVKGLTEDETLVVIDKLFTYYKNEANPGEKVGDFINRTGLEAMQAVCGI